MLTAAEVENEILRLCALLEERTHALATMAREAAESEVNYKSLHARAFLAAEGSVQAKSAKADLQCHDRLMERRTREAVYAAGKELCLTLRAELDALRTIAANIRSQT